MPAGSKPGERRGGRKIGKPNNKTDEALMLARRIVDEADRAADAVKGTPGRKMSEEVLREFMELFAGMAAYHQPLPKDAPVPPGRDPDEHKFEKWARLTVKVAADLIPYERPSFRAINVPAPAGAGAEKGPRKRRFTLDVFEGARHAGRVIDGKVVELPSPTAAPAKKKAAAK